MTKLTSTIGILALLSFVGCKKQVDSDSKIKSDSVEVDSLVYDSVIISHKTDTINLDEDSVEIR